MSSNHIQKPPAPISIIPGCLLVDIFESHIAQSVPTRINYSAVSIGRKRPKFPVLRAALVLTHVCSQWRKIGWSYGRFWSHIMIRFELSADGVDVNENCPERHSRRLLFQLARSKDTLLDIRLDWDAFYQNVSNLQRDLEQLANYSTRWRSFTFLSKNNSTIDLQAVLLPIKGKLPNLQTLVLSKYPAGLDIFDGTYTLRRVRIDRFQLHNLRLGLIWNVLTSLELKITLVHLAALMPWCSNLEELTLAPCQANPSDLRGFNECNVYPVRRLTLEPALGEYGVNVLEKLSLRNQPSSLTTLCIDTPVLIHSLVPLLVDCSSTLTEFSYTLGGCKRTSFKDFCPLLELVPRLVKLTIVARNYCDYNPSFVCYSATIKKRKREVVEIFRFFGSPSILPDLKHLFLSIEDAPYVRDAVTRFIRSRWTLNENMLPSRHPTTGTTSLESVVLRSCIIGKEIRNFSTTEWTYYWMVYNQGLKIEWLTDYQRLDVRDGQRFGDDKNRLLLVEDAAFELEGSFMDDFVD